MAKVNVKDIAGIVTKTDSIDYTVPKGHPEAGKEYPVPFDYFDIVTEGRSREEIDATLTAVMEAKEWNLLDMVRDRLKGSARSNKYQLESAKYKAPKKSKEETLESMVRSMVQQGTPEELARQTISTLLGL